MTRALAIGLLFLLGIASGAQAVSSWSVHRFSEARGGTLLFADARGQTESYFTSESDGDSTRILRTTDSGLTWTSIGAAAPVAGEGLSLRSLARDRETSGDLLLSADSSAYRRSRETGEWSGFGPSGDGAITAVAVFPDRGILVARRESGGNARLFRSTDDGTNWSPVTTPGLMRVLSSLSGFASGPMWALDGAGQLWRADSTEFVPAAPFAIRHVSVESELAATAFGADHRIARTTNAGQSWETQPGDLQSIWSEELDASFAFGEEGTVLWLASPSMLVVSMDAGFHWKIALEGDHLLSSIARNPVQHDFLCGGAEVLFSSDQGESWQVRSGADFSRLALVTAASAFGLDHGLIASFDGGETWERWPLPGPADGLRSLRFFDLNGYLARDGESGPALFVSRDRGRSWSGAPEAPRGITDIARTSDGSTWFGTTSGLFRSTNAGASFSKPESAGFSRVDCLAAADSLLGVVSASALFVSRDRGASWTEHVAPEAGIAALRFANADTIFAAGSALFRTSDGGAHWQPISGTARTGARWRSFAAPNASTFWASGDQGALASCVDGWSFRRFSENLEVADPGAQLGALSFSGAVGLCGAFARVLRYYEDAQGPNFRLQVVLHPYLERSAHLYFNARERMLGDSVVVEIDGRRIGLRAERDPFVFHYLYAVPGGSTNRAIRVSGADLSGNARSVVIPFSVDRGHLLLRQDAMELEWSAGDSGLLFAYAVASEELPPLPPSWIPVGDPIVVQRRGSTSRDPSELRARLRDQTGLAMDIAMLDVHGWSRCSIARAMVDEAGLILWGLVHAEEGADVVTPEALSAWPNPAREEVRLRFGRGDDGWWRASMFDLLGRKLSTRRLEVRAGEASWPVRVPSSGHYWIRLERESNPADTHTVPVILLTR